MCPPSVAKQFCMSTTMRASMGLTSWGCGSSETLDFGDHVLDRGHLGKAHGEHREGNPLHLLARDRPETHVGPVAWGITVTEEDDLVVTRERVAGGRLATHVSDRAADDQRVDTLAPEDCLEIGSMERAVAGLGHHEVAGVRLERVVDLHVLRSLEEGLVVPVG